MSDINLKETLDQDSLIKLDFAENINPQQVAEKNLIFKCITGSHAYGMATTKSDLDIRGVFVGAQLNVISPFFPIEQVKGLGDTVYYELSKYMKLLVDQNPNILDLLWVDKNDILFESPAWKLLKDIRHELLTTRLRHTFGGYAFQALSKMKSHSRWINNPQPESPPKPIEFMSMVHNLTLSKSFNKSVPFEGNWSIVDCSKDLYLLFEQGRGTWFDKSGNIRSLTREEAEKSGMLNKSPAAIVKFNRDQYEPRKRDYDNYWTWRKNRNVERGLLEDQVQFDGKDAAHLLRLCNMCLEGLKEGHLRVKRTGAELEELSAVRRGEIDYQTVIAKAEMLEQQIKEAELTSKLPKKINMLLVGETVMKMYDMIWASQNNRTFLPLKQNDSLSKNEYDHSNIQEKVIEEFPDVRKRVVVIDTEMTGLNGPNGIVVEVAAVEVMGGVLTGKVFHSYVNPQGELNPFATEIHGLTADFLKTQPIFKNIASGLLEFIGNSPMVMHSAAGDLKALNYDLQIAGFPTLDTKRVFCSLRISRRLFPGTQLSLDKLCDLFKVDRSNRIRGHTALIDSNLLAQSLIKMAEMPLYRTIKNVHPKKQRKTDLIVSKQLGEKRDYALVTVNVKENKVAFTLLNNEKIIVDLPNYNSFTHFIIPTRKGSLIVLKHRNTDEKNNKNNWMYKFPDNPIGPAILDIYDGQLRETWLVDGKEVNAQQSPLNQNSFDNDQTSDQIGFR